MELQRRCRKCASFADADGVRSLGMGQMRVVLLVCVIGCGDDGGSLHMDARMPDSPHDTGGGGMAHGTARMLNGASPGMAQFANKLVAPAASDGNWQISPTKIVAPL